eukprot:1001622-Pelagomonas_calceolata.AAC.3
MPAGIKEGRKEGRKEERKKDNTKQRTKEKKIEGKRQTRKLNSACSSGSIRRPPCFLLPKLCPGPPFAATPLGGLSKQKLFP